MAIPQRAAYIDGPFLASEKPWLLSNQRKLGINIQTDGSEGYFSQPHGYLRSPIGHRITRDEGENTGFMVKPKQDRPSKRALESRKARA